MLFLMAHFWLWLAAALVLGLAVGWFTFRNYDKNWWKDLLPWGIGLVVGLLIAALKILPTRVGFWLDLALLMTAFYLIGCFLAGWLRCKKGAEDATIAAPVVAAATSAAAVAPVIAAPAVVTPAASVAVTSPVDASEEAITGLSGPLNGKADDLKKIYGIDAETEAKLNGLGIYHYSQLASLNPGQRRWLFAKLGYEGRFPSWWWRWRYDAEQLVAGNAPVAETTPVAVAAAAPVKKPAAKAKPVAADAEPEGVKPTGLAAPRGGKADDLKRIRGIGKQNEGRLHGLGIWHFDQISQWNAEEAQWVGGYLAFPGRIEREDWVGQAKILAAGGVTEFATRVDAGKVATSLDNTNDDGQNNVIKIEGTTPPPKK